MISSKHSELKAFLDRYHEKYNQPAFIENDPISIPHRFSKLEDVEIIGFFSAILAWGQRITTINKCKELVELMGGAPYDFIVNHQEADLKQLEQFKHRTFNSTDLLYFIAFFKWFYQNHSSLEEAFLPADKSDYVARERLTAFHQLFFSLDFTPSRTRKHVANAGRNSACKRLNMYLRWMVRKDQGGVDIGLWNRISMSDLMCPLDVHVERSARKLGLLSRTQRDWKAVEELTGNLRVIDPEDPVKYDFALLGIGLENSRIPNFT